MRSEFAGLAEYLRRHSTHKSVGTCGQYGARSIVSRAPGSARAAGAIMCGTAWSCPQCASRIAARRRDGVAYAAALFDSAALVTLTLQHHRGEALVDVLARVRKAWTRVRGGRGGWRGEYVRALEVTEGEGGGWHPHIHVICEGREAAALVARWREVAERAGAKAQKVRENVDPERGGEYLTKQCGALAWEMVGSGNKESAHWSILRRAAMGPDSAERRKARALWREFEQGMRGVKQLTWSRGLREATKAMHPEAFEDGAPVEESENAAVDEQVLVRLEFGAWSKVWRDGFGPAVMGAAAAWDAAALESYLRAVIPGEYVLGTSLDVDPPEVTRLW